MLPKFIFKNFFIMIFAGAWWIINIVFRVKIGNESGLLSLQPLFEYVSKPGNLLTHIRGFSIGLRGLEPPLCLRPKIFYTVVVI
mgnify:CR=1 FL=1